MQNRQLIDPHFRNDLRNISFFLELMRSPLGVSTNLRRMNRYGVLGRYLPEFGRIIGLMQFDLFHAYTVDAHSILTVENLRRFRHQSVVDHFPVATKIVNELPKIELAYIAALFHDIGKARGGDHAKEGAKEVMLFCERHRMADWDSKLITWLVENHLMMASTVQRQDIMDPEVIFRFAKKVGDVLHLNYLYVLTIADIHATNPKLWNSWKSTLLRQLYEETKRLLRAGLETPINKESRIRDTQDKALQLLAEDGFSPKEILELWGNPGDDYFLRETAQDIAWHTKALARQGMGSPLVLISETSDAAYEGATKIFIYAPDRANLFADIATVLDQLRLSIQDARIMTSSASNYSLDTFIVLEEDGTSIGDNPDRIREIQHKLLLTISSPEGERVPAVSHRISRRLKSFKLQPKVFISNSITEKNTVIEVITADRPGLLAVVGRVFKQHGVVIHNARISTLGERAEDVFFCLDSKGEALSDPDFCEALRHQLINELTQLQEES